MNDFMSDWNGCPKSLSVAFTLNFADCSWYIHHEGDRACASRPVRQPDRRQVLGDHKVGQRISHFHHFNSSCSATSMALMPPDRSRARPPICSWRGSRSTTIRPLEGNMCQGWEHLTEWFYPGLHQYMGNSGRTGGQRPRRGKEGGRVVRLLTGISFPSVLLYTWSPVMLSILSIHSEWTWMVLTNNCTDDATSNLNY